MSRPGIKLKVCGMRDIENIGAVAGLRPDYMGFIFYKGSARCVPENFILPDDSLDGIERVGVFVNESTEVMMQLAKKHQFRYLQLHGTETPGQCDEIKSEGMGVIKVFSVDEDFDFKWTEPYKNHADYFLFDTKGPGYGGTGKTFDWNLLKRYDQEIAFFLSGGLSPANLPAAEGLARMNLHALDLNSRVEIGPGVKDLDLIQQVQEILGKWKEG